MLHLFESIYSTLHASSGLALMAAFIWGIFSILLSPCNLVTIPLVVGYIESTRTAKRASAFAISLAFSAGIFVNLALIGMVLTSTGILMTDISLYTNYFVAGVFFLIGLHLLNVITLPWFGQKEIKANKNKGLLGALILGVLSGLALGPCSFAYVAPLLALTIKTATTNLPFALLLVSFYAIGHCSVIVIAGTSTDFVSKFLKWDEKSKALTRVNYICGVLILIAGLYFIYTAPL
ncbi:MAG: cytochrome c biogenesis protein CcdA [Aminobacterium sp.]|jgi:cytochrome c-type biogenesis protein|uniref:cytochrome c biogenesis CcdA family protein n=1 Tax=unclassified Aminobacterium TaxID=2685012 RepID=UPI001BD031A8|nr:MULTISPECIES: cytochrome c biogenesis protein CcdA [unclassified Aminobacterium]MDD2206014.1 cytochrome c biogenesis protein CcdA [Aminobacterium sp.]MDD3707191.1 cytochrome c biogenesis protein CcdA [Aminobacterium sp.]MDD4227829.1 cytochrome c biogenesis protein CcdA [Aminobacterium sp.]MDD4550731.1 cytochrome c biogenesis protein CcdA [Aminobacterium sp.]MEA4877367.1 cytochrome c biogenesis protein CcdA [Aminobacterium sp.]